MTVSNEKVTSTRSVENHGVDAVKTKPRDDIASGRGLRDPMDSKENDLNAKLVWQKGMSFETQIRTHRFQQDVSREQGGEDSGPSPKEHLLAAVIGCTGMDVVSILAKMRASFETCEVEAEAAARDEHPRIFPRIDVTFRLQGVGLQSEPVIKAVRMSLTKYCGVSAMIDPTSPIYYRIFVNDQKVHEDQADFVGTGSPP